MAASWERVNRPEHCGFWPDHFLLKHLTPQTDRLVSYFYIFPGFLETKVCEMRQLKC